MDKSVTNRWFYLQNGHERKCFLMIGNLGSWKTFIQVHQKHSKHNSILREHTNQTQAFRQVLWFVWKYKQKFWVIVCEGKSCARMLRIIKLAFHCCMFCFGSRIEFLVFYLVTCCSRVVVEIPIPSGLHVRKCSSTYLFGEVGFSEDEMKTRENINKLPEENRDENKKTTTNHKVVYLFHCPFLPVPISAVTKAQYVFNAIIWLQGSILIFRRLFARWK